MKKIIRHFHRLYIQRKLYRQYGNYIRVDFRNDRLLRLPDNPRRHKSIEAALKYIRSDGDAAAVVPDMNGEAASGSASEQSDT